jgi:8-oxo-dGTP pyrophosphatase MutT (NUDIX family)
MGASPGPISALIDRHVPLDDVERADLSRVRALLAGAGDPWLRTIPLHLTASACVVHPASGRVLLRWHLRHRSWLLVGGHADPDERDPLAIALREGREETGLTDLAPWPDAALRHVAVVPVPASDREPAHEHADLRFVLATARPEAARAEHPDTPLRWLAPVEACSLVTEENIGRTLARAERLLAGRRC